MIILVDLSEKSNAEMNYYGGCMLGPSGKTRTASRAIKGGKTPGCWRSPDESDGATLGGD